MVFRQTVVYEARRDERCLGADAGAHAERARQREGILEHGPRAVEHLEVFFRGVRPGREPAHDFASVIVAVVERPRAARVCAGGFRLESPAHR